MSMRAAITGRLGKDASTRITKSGNEMASSTMIVDVSPFGAPKAEPVTIWISISAFGRLAGELSVLKKGAVVSVAGNVSLAKWADKAGGAREQLQIVADSIIAATPNRGREYQRTSDTPAGYGNRS